VQDNRLVLFGWLFNTGQPDVTTAQVIGKLYFGPISDDGARKVAREVVDMIGLGDRPDMLAASLTTAGKKRLELARALSARPRLLLLDEVLAGLNPTETEGMIATVQKIRDSGVAILMIEHIMRAVMSLSDRIVVLNLGSKLAEGSPQQVADNPDVITAYLGDSKLLSVAEKPA